MIKIEKTELMSINGGGFSLGACFGISSLVVFIIGVIDGFVRPFKCR